VTDPLFSGLKKDYRLSSETSIETAKSESISDGLTVDIYLPISLKSVLSPCLVQALKAKIRELIISLV
jgi:hypothetical protein